MSQLSKNYTQLLVILHSSVDGNQLEVIHVWNHGLGFHAMEQPVTVINLAGLDLGGTLGWQLNLPNLWRLDLSFNHIEGGIPGSLPLNITYIDLSSNKFSMNIPYSVASMKHLHHLNLSHNMLYGPISDLFGDLQNLKEMDLSYNSFTGDLPSSFGYLTNLGVLYLQDNKFSGHVTLLENLRLVDLNISNNEFSSDLSTEFQTVSNLWPWGNDFPPLDEYVVNRFARSSTRSQNDQEPRVSKLMAFISGIILFFVGVVIVRRNYIDRFTILRQWPDDMGIEPGLELAPFAPPRQLAPPRKIILSFQMCDRRPAKIIEYNVPRTYQDLVTAISKKVYGSYLGNAVALDRLTSEGVIQADMHLLGMFFTISQYQVEIIWSRDGKKYQSLTANTNWNEFVRDVKRIQAVPHGEPVDVVLPHWL